MVQRAVLSGIDRDDDLSVLGEMLVVTGKGGWGGVNYTTNNQFVISS